MSEILLQLWLVPTRLSGLIGLATQARSNTAVEIATKKPLTRLSPATRPDHSDSTTTRAGRPDESVYLVANPCPAY